MSVKTMIAAATVLGILSSGAAFARGSSGSTGGHAAPGGHSSPAVLGNPGGRLFLGRIQTVSVRAPHLAWGQPSGPRPAFGSPRPDYSHRSENGGPPNGGGGVTAVNDNSDVGSGCTSTGAVDPQAAGDGLPIVIYGSAPKCGAAANAAGPGIYTMQ